MVWARGVSCHAALNFCGSSKTWQWSKMHLRFQLPGEQTASRRPTQPTPATRWNTEVSRCRLFAVNETTSERGTFCLLDRHGLHLLATDTCHRGGSAGFTGVLEELGGDGGRSLTWKMKLNTSSAASQGSRQRSRTRSGGLLSPPALPASRTVMSLFPVAAGQHEGYAFRGKGSLSLPLSQKERHSKTQCASCCCVHTLAPEHFRESRGNDWSVWKNNDARQHNFSGEEKKNLLPFC